MMGPENEERTQRGVTGSIATVASGAVDALRVQPGLLFLTIVNICFLVFVYFIGTLVLDAYNKDQERIAQRYELALKTVDRCVDVGLRNVELQQLDYRRPPMNPPD